MSFFPSRSMSLGGAASSTVNDAVNACVGAVSYVVEPKAIFSGDQY